MNIKKLSAALIFGVATLYGEGLGSLVEKLKNNDGLQAAMMNEQKSVEQKNSTLTAYSPKLEAFGTYYKKANGVVFEPKEVKSGELRASMIIFDGFKREAKYSTAKKNMEAFAYKTKYTKQSLMLDTIREYYSYFDAKAALEAVRFKKSELDGNVKKLTVLTENGLATKDTLEAVVAAKKDAEFEESNIALAMENSLLKLELYTNAPVENLTLTKLREVNTQAAGDRDDIKADKLTVESLKHAEKQNTYLPTLALQDSYKKYKYSYYDDMGGMQKLPAYNNELTLQLSFTIFDFGLIKKEREIARLEAMSAAKNLAYKETSAKIEARLKQSEYTAAKTKAEAAKASLAATDTTYDYTKKRFDANLVSYTDYLTELTKKYEALSRAKSAENNVEIKKAELAFAMGIDLDTLINGDEK
jgi:outer membrane protein